ncbi:MAG: serine hydrolase [Bacteroidales bacterium]|nr:serine hydrolase [Bacteroidales bacterium]
MKKHFSLLAAALLVCGVAFGQDSKPSKEEVVKEIDNYIQEVMDTWKIPGMAAAFSLDNQPLFAKGYGVKEVRPADGIGFRGIPASDRRIASGGVPGVVNTPGEPIDVNTVFQIGSVSKSFTATIMGQLVDEGLVNWNDTVKNILPDFRYYDPYVTENMQVIDVMTHSTGIGGQVGTYFPNLGYDRDDCYRMLALIKPAYSFRGAYQYNNSTFLIAEKIIEKVTGKSWEENLQERVFNKAGMKSSSANAEGFAASKNVATPHDYRYTTVELAKMQFPELADVPADTKGEIVTLPLYGDEQALYWLTGVGPAGSINSTVMDMLRYAQMHMNNGYIVDPVYARKDVGGAPSAMDTTFVMSEKAMRKLHTGVTITSQADNRTTLYAQCWFVEQNNRYRLYFHTGTTWGMTAICFFVPEIKLSGVLLSNCEMGSNPRYAIMYKLIDLVMGLPSKDYNKDYFESYITSNEKSWAKELAAEKPAKVAPAPEKAIIGEYAKDELFGDARISKGKDGLYIELGKMGYRNKLVHQNGNTWLFRSDGYAFPVEFAFDAQGKKATGFIVKFPNGEEESIGGWSRK